MCEFTLDELISPAAQCAGNVQFAALHSI